MLGSFPLVLVSIMCVQEIAMSVKITELRVPAHVAEGSEALLGCQYELGEDTLYSVKWYKDDSEFYRYAPRKDPPYGRFFTPGVLVDVRRSSSDVVSLFNMTQHSAGLYRCEVTGEAPLFTTVFDQKYISVHLLPESPPQISGLKDEYQLGDRAVLNCSSPASRPETKLQWWVNERPANRDHLQGPWYRTAMDRPDATETILQLRFTVMARHFQDGVMKFKCTATIAPLYHDETVYSLRRGAPEPVHTDEDDQTTSCPVSPVSYFMPKREADSQDETQDHVADSATTLRISSLVLINCILRAAMYG